MRRKKTIGVFAHVDAGKTTFCEALLYLTGAIPALGRVDHGSSLLDHNELEQRRGITIFCDVADFSFGGQGYHLVDTPGHVDFSAEMERTLSILDGAVLLLSAVDGVQSHTLTLFRLLRERGIPLFLFLNKTDHPGADIPRCLKEIGGKLTPDYIYLERRENGWDDGAVERLCDWDEALMERYLEGQATAAAVGESLRGLVGEGKIVPVQSGSALHQEGVSELLDLLNHALPHPPAAPEAFAARAFKLLYDEKGTRITFLKVLGGSLRPRDVLTVGETGREKVHELRLYRGKRYKTLEEAHPGDIVGVTGLTGVLPGMGLGECEDERLPRLQPALQAAVIQGVCGYDEVMACLRKLEAQDPLLQVVYETGLKEIQVRVMGKIQLEILQELIRNRYGLDIAFGPCRIRYKETVAAPVKGYGHYEPLRHYAEVHLRLEPNPQGGLDFASECHTDRLPAQHQNLIRHHLLSREHKGVLTGSTLTDVRFVLTAGAHHLKHTEGGDFREAGWRAVRQGLEKAESVLLEPYYAFLIDVDTASLGRVLSDITRLHGEFEPPVTTGTRSAVTGKGPVETFLDYPEELLSFTKGSGAISQRLLGYFPCHDPQRVIDRVGYRRERDLENPSSSVFCAKGAGFEVKWQDVEAHLHLPK